MAHPHFNKIQFNQLTFIEYDCPLEEAVVPIWTPHDYVVHVLNGKKTWHTYPEGKIVLQKGDTAYIKKGGHFVHQHFEDNFCLLVFFITDEIKKELTFSELPPAGQLPKPEEDPVICRIKSNAMLQGFIYSVMTYFKMPQPPTDEIKKLKLKEFVHVLSTEPENMPVIRHLLTKEQDALALLKTIMGQNYMFNLSLKEFAALCNRSVSSFRRDFAKCYHTSLSHWLSTMRLNHASSLLRHTNLSVTQVALESGYENLSHFSRCFREKYLETPSQFRQRQNLNTTA